MLELYITLAVLGVCAVDPIGIAAMPVLLTQKNPIIRSSVFLGGSFVSLIVMGYFLAKGFGHAVLHFEQSNAWFVPAVEAVAAGTLFVIAGMLVWRLRSGRLSVKPPARMQKQLQLGNWQLCIGGALLVAIQSVADVVFVIAMIRVGQLRLSNIRLFAALSIYAVMALLLQLSVVVAFLLTTPKQRKKTLDKVHLLLTHYANQVLIGVSFLLGCVLLALAI